MRLTCSLITKPVTSSKDQCKGHQNKQWFNHLHDHLLSKFWIQHALGALLTQSMMLHKEKLRQLSPFALLLQNDGAATRYTASSLH